MQAPFFLEILKLILDFSPAPLPTGKKINFLAILLKQKEHIFGGPPLFFLNFKTLFRFI